MRKVRVVVAMSGGVDSSVAAALLVQQGYDVIGIMLRLWAEELRTENAGRNGVLNSNRCCTPEAVADARAIAKLLGIPFYDIHAEGVFKQRVVDTWIAAYADATTPNPCFTCNRTIRFGFLMQKALALGADYLATGHYARVERLEIGRLEIRDSALQSPISNLQSPFRYRLLKGKDAHRDQSYVLHVLGQKDLARAMFPVGEYTKEEVRRMAREFGLPTAERPESQDLCFLTQGDYRSFLIRNAPEVARPGPIINTRGEVIGQHEGLPFYTIGQRKGIHVSVRSAHSEPLYVLRLDPANNAVVVGSAGELGTRIARTHKMHYVSGEPPAEPLRCTAKIRYKAKEAAGWLKPLPDGGAVLEFDEPQRDVTPGQGLVCYLGDEVIGGGVIARDA
ncbi:MAG: tRNA 2-thiouridine(34) synthase MnmA [Anaerolineae bacterium]|nr:tRNA 2-thiouridine(34) synthase MnmA [Candidatus Roseilinea sp.]MDW8450309.1 tRNA 2-thiouridine(34) synthase MnmA [Anaerolineae bacterium]